jgi:hypothetical protein
MEERLRHPRRRARTVVASDDSALMGFINLWLARRGLEAIPRNGTLPGGGSAPPAGSSTLETPGQPNSRPAPAGSNPTDAHLPPMASFPRPAGGPGSPLVYPKPGPDPWVDPLPHLSLGPLDIDTGRRSVRLLGEEVHVTPTEFRLLCYLVEHSDRVVGHRELLLSVWGPGYGDDVHLLQVTIRDLRARITHINECPIIESVYGTGYRMASWPDPKSPPPSKVASKRP